MTRKQEIAREILRQLGRCEDATDEAVLHVAVEGRCGRITMADFFGALEWCEEQGWVSGTEDGLRGFVWMLTNKGRLVQRA